jgi:hypothetical protein
MPVAHLPGRDVDNGVNPKPPFGMPSEQTNLLFSGGGATMPRAASAAEAVGFDMRRWMLGLIGAVLLAAPLILAQLKPFVILGVAGWASIPSDLPIWLRVSILAGAYLVKWGPALAGMLILFYAIRVKH